MPEVALATCAALPDLDDDESLLLSQLQSRGVTATAEVWDDPAVDWDRFDVVVVRCTWDYQDRRAEFVDWARGVPRLHNPAAVLEWSTDKRYLSDLESAGVAVVPTTWLAPGAAAQLPAAGEWVLKPAIGAGSRNAGRYRLNRAAERAEAQQLTDRIHAMGRTAMAQPYQAAVDQVGEKALIYIAGEFSHAVRKAAMLDGPSQSEGAELFKPEQIKATTATAAECALAQSALEAVPGESRRLLYARVDVVADETGEPRVLELELAEPSLFFGLGDRAAARMADAVEALTRP